MRPRNDEPPVLLGEDRAANAVELVLASFGFCYSVGYVANAAAPGHRDRRDGVRARGRLRRAQLPRPRRRTAARLQGDPCARASEGAGADETQLKSCGYVQQTSPVRDMLVNEVPVKTTIEQVA